MRSMQAWRLRDFCIPLVRLDWPSDRRGSIEYALRQILMRVDCGRRHFLRWGRLVDGWCCGSVVLTELYELAKAVDRR